MAVERGMLFDASVASGQIRDTSAHNSSRLDWGEVEGGRYLFAAENGLNQDVSLQYQGSLDGTNWHNLQSAVAVTAGSKDHQSLDDPWKYVRCVATCAVAPASGGLTLHWAWREDR